METKFLVPLFWTYKISFEYTYYTFFFFCTVYINVFLSSQTVTNVQCCLEFFFQTEYLQHISSERCVGITVSLTFRSHLNVTIEKRRSRQSGAARKQRRGAIASEEFNHRRLTDIHDIMYTHVTAWAILLRENNNKTPCNILNGINPGHKNTTILFGCKTLI